MTTPHPAPAAVEGPEVALRRHFGFPSFRSGQRELVDAALEGRDALGILPTGGGKSLCYQVPAILRPGLTLVVSPLVSLMEDQAERAREAGIPAAALHANLSPAARERTMRRLESGELKVLLVAPERVTGARFIQSEGMRRTSLLVVDEAHCISCWGMDFRPCYRELGAVRRRLSVPVLALTASATPRVRADIRSVLGMRNPVQVIGSFDRPNLRFAVRPVVDRREKGRVIVREVRAAGGGRMVYAATRRRVERIRSLLARRGIRAEAYHAGLPAGERERVQRYFMTDPSPVVVATNAFGMGIDRSDVRLVIHDQLPGSLEDYYQEAGRAGRDGLPACCLALHSPSDHLVHRAFTDRTHPPIRSPRRLWRLWRSGELGHHLERRRAERTKWAGVARFAVSRQCRRAMLLGWFGEKIGPEACGGCDRCGTVAGF